MPITAEERAQRSAEAMWALDRASPWLGMSLGAVGPGTAETTLEVTDHHCNGHGICHGGVIFSLADSAFAFACNSRNQLAVAHQNAITFCTPARLGDRLTARAHEVTTSGRSGVYDATVTNQDGTIIAVMRGNSRTIKGQHFEEEEA